MLKEAGHFKVIKTILVSLLFFPSITFGLLQAEVFPWGILICGLIILKQNKINTYFVLLLLMFLLNIVVFSIYNFTEIKIVEVLRSSLAYINSLIAFIAFYQASKTSTLKTINLVKYLFYFLLVLGIFQSLGLLAFLDPVFKFLIPRASSESLSHLKRGVTLLATEPARAGVSLVFMYIMYRAVFAEKKIVTDILFFFYILVIIKSIMALGVFFVFILLTYRLKIVRLMVFGLMFLYLIDISGGGGRTNAMINKVKNQESFESAAMVVVDLAGPRLISVYTSWLHTVNFHPFGGGIGYWETSSVKALKMTNLDFHEINYFRFKGNSKPIPIRSSGYVSNLVLDTGFIGVFVFFLLMYVILKKYWKDQESKTIILIFLFKILFVGSVGPPDAWIAAIITLKYLHYKSQIKHELT